MPTHVLILGAGGQIALYVVVPYKAMPRFWIKRGPIFIDVEFSIVEARRWEEGGKYCCYFGARIISCFVCIIGVAHETKSASVQFPVQFVQRDVA